VFNMEDDDDDDYNPNDVSKWSLDEINKENLKASYSRYEHRKEKWKYVSGKKFPLLRYRFWWMTHNLIAHNLIGVFPFQVFFKFHDYTSNKLNLKK